MADRKSSWLRGWYLVLLLYALMLIASHLWRSFHPYTHPVEDRLSSVMLKAVQGDSLLDNTSIRLAYLDVYKGSDPDPPVVILIHGSPIAVPMFSELIPELSDSFRIIAPDMPGYDASARDVPDYSIRAQAFYIEQLMDSLAIERAHLVGYSLGGGTAIKMAHFFPEKVLSIDLLSAIGVQELELFGNYSLNHAIHGIQLGFCWLLHEAVPHFGLVDGFPINVEYARSFYDSDQRPIRSYLQNYSGPMLIQHGIDDSLVPFAVAKEHHRIVPQSELITYASGHGIVISKAKKVAEDFGNFVRRVENNEALSRREASRQRLLMARQPFENVEFSEFEGITLILVLMLISLSTLISEDLTCIGAGLMAARGLIGFWPATFACFIGIFLGDIALYLAGKWLGRPALRYAPFKWLVSESDLEKSAEWFGAKGPAIIIASRFLPGSRLPTYFSAGVIGAGFWMFVGYFILAAVVWTPILVGLSMIIGSELINYFAVYQNYALWVILGTVLLIFMIVKIIVPFFSYKGRRLLYSSYRRITRWEYWPPYLIYAPVCLYVVYLWFKYKSLTVFTAANPGIIDGGFIGESKIKILDLFRSSGKVASYDLIPNGWSNEVKLQSAQAFMRENMLEFPVVLKPDIGQRGKGVKIIKNERQLQKVLYESDQDLIVQAYAEGEEFGVFYYRYPDEEEGHIFSVTTKKMLTLKGDGKSTLQELILNDKRAVCLAKKHLKRYSESLYNIPEKGQVIPLVEIGTHARGAVFEDGEALITEDLRERMDTVSREAPGFYFGRYDIRTPSVEDLKAGRKLTIIEVNGVTSESTNIYDPSFGFWDAQRILCRQWRIAFDIGNRNRCNGVVPSRIPALVKKLVEYK